MLNKNKVLLLFVVSLAGFPAYAGEEHGVTLPPASMAEWYKPVNERQVWLHTMFGLRREMQAVEEYLLLGEWALGGKWADRLVNHYRKIGEMVPEWRDELEMEQAEALPGAVAGGEVDKASGILRKLGLSCRSCHRDYRAVTALLYRSPDFSGTRIEDSETLEELSYETAMERLSTLVNRVKIASEDGRGQAATDALGEMRRRLDDLGTSCESCHPEGDARERILGAATVKALGDLESSLAAGDSRGAGRHLGTVAVMACAKCHSVHRTLADMRKVLQR